jgi:putative membrane protein
MMKQRIFGIALAAIAVSLWLAPSSFAGQSQEVSPDQTFAKKAVVGGLAEVQLGKIAVEHAASPDVKQFGQRMVEDHGNANRELMALVEKKGISVPTALDQKHQEEADRLAKLRGAAFDRAYIQHMVKDHEEDVRLFSTQAKEGKDSELRSFAAKTLPTLEEHLNMARSLAKKHP